jgi:hypothetical protein
MSIHLMCRGMLVVGITLLGLACGPTPEEAQPVSQHQEERAEDTFRGDNPRKRRPACAGREPGQRYVSRDPNECLLIDFICAEGFTPFFNDCGCGCQKQKKACDYDDPRRSYVSRDPVQCLAITFECAEGSRQFFDDCGCGCVNPP